MKYSITAKRLNEALNDNNMTQQDLADKSQIGKSSISHYINGTHAPGNKAAYEMGNVLNVNPLWLMGLDAPKDEAPAYKQEEVEKAMQLYKQYQKAIPQVQSAVEALLKPSQSDP